jgi:hypothetical protein
VEKSTERELNNWAQEGIKWNTLSAAGKTALQGVGVSQPKADSMSKGERTRLLGSLAING